MVARRLGVTLSLTLALVTLGPVAQRAQADPSGWSIEPSPNSAPVPADTYGAGTTCVTSTDCWAVGWYTVGGTNQTMIQHWDGATWSLVASPNTGPTQTNILRGVTCVTSTDCWAVGLRSNEDGNAQTMTLHWDGTAWSIVPSANTSGTRSQSLSSVTCTSASNCWAVGTYANASFVNQTLIERWNGSSWSIIASPSSAANQPNYLNAVSCASASDCVAVGSRGATPSEQTLILRWNGSSWSIVTSPNTGNGHNNLYGVTCTPAADCWAVGYATIGNVQQTLITRWNGTLWSTVLSPNGGVAQNTTLFAVTCVGATICWAVGSTSPAGGQQAFTARWDGSSWVSVAAASVAGAHRFAGVHCATASDCWAVGTRPADDIQQALLERWNGTSWDVIPSASGLTPTQNTLIGSTCVTSTDCWAVGGYSTGTALRTKTQHWNGLAWSVIPSPNPSATNSTLYSISCVTSSDCWAVGYAAGLSAFQTTTMHWDGATWSLVASPNTAIAQNNFLNEVTCVSATECWAVGFYDAGGGYQTLILRWNGSSWAIAPSANVGSFQENRLYGVTCVGANDCWAVGRYVVPEGFIRSLVQHWDGATWSLVTAPITSDTQSNYLWSVSCSSTTDCWTVGATSYGSGTGRTLILRWDGASWSIAPSPNPTALPFDYIFLRDVACTSATECYAAGYYFDDGVNRSLVERWDGVAWTIVATPLTGPTQANHLFSIGCPSPGVCIASGYYTNDHAVLQTLTLRFGEPPNQAPTAALTATPTAGVAPLTVNLDASASTDPNIGDGIASYEFDLGDGSAPSAQAGSARGHTYITPGVYVARVRVTDRRGLSSAIDATASVTVRPPAPAISSPANGSIVTQTAVTISGTSMPGTAVEITRGGSPLASTVADEVGQWSVQSDLADGAHAIVARATHASGTTSEPSATRTFSVDTTAPGAPVISSPIDGATLADSYVTFTGTAEPGAHLVLRNGGDPIGETSATATGAWAVAVGMTNGTHEVTATATDAVGNVSAPSTTTAFTVDDTQLPGAPTITAPTEASSVSLAVVEGTAEPGAMIALREEGALLATASANAAGTWRAVLFDISTGTHSVTASATDPAGNVGASSAPRSFRVVGAPSNALAITSPGEGSLHPSAVTFTGVGAKPGVAIALYEGNTRLGTVMPSSNGTWSIGVALGSGAHTVVATTAGSAPSTSLTIHVDAEPPTVSTTAAPPAFLPGQGTEIVGSAADNHSVVAVWVTFSDAFHNQVAKVAATCACGPGATSVTWSARPTLPPGSYTASAQSVDATGNLSPIRRTSFLRI